MTSYYAVRNTDKPVTMRLGGDGVSRSIDTFEDALRGDRIGEIDDIKEDFGVTIAANASDEDVYNTLRPAGLFFVMHLDGIVRDDWQLWGVSE